MPRPTKGRRPTPASRHATLASSDRSRAFVKMSSGPPVPADVRAHAIEQLAAAAAQSKVSDLPAEVSLSFKSVVMGVTGRTEIEIVADTNVRRAHSGDRIAVPLTSTFLRPSLALAGRRCVELRLDLTGQAAYLHIPIPWMATNVGLQLTYRQSWRLPALQVGELVKTAPLDPGQRERVSMKIIHRRKVTTGHESKEEMETATNTTNTTKDSSEIVLEAGNTFSYM